MIYGSKRARRQGVVALFGGPAGAGKSTAAQYRLSGEATCALATVLPSLDETCARSGQRDKRVREEHTRTQHARCAAWDEPVRIDTTGVDLEQSLALVLDRLR